MRSSTSIAYLDGGTPQNIKQKIDDGVRIGGNSEETARIGREYTKRTMPV